MANKNKAAMETAKTAAGIAAVPTPKPTPAQKLTKTGLPAMPRLKRTRKPKAPKVCACGCGNMTKGGRFVPGHDARLHGWALRVERKVCTLEDVAKADGQGVADAVKAHMAVSTKKSA